VALRGAAARRYAQAVFDIAKDANSLDKWLNDLKALNGVFGTPNAQAHLEDPRLTEEDQRRMVAQQLEKVNVDPLAINLLLLLVKRNRTGLLPRIVERFQELYNSEKGVVVADVTTAVPLDEAHKQRVAAELSKMTGGKTIDLRLHEDPKLLGGVVTRIGDQLIDASLATRLAQLAERMV
jgi:F-type H+-transporting ATPase subunit delta